MKIAWFVMLLAMAARLAAAQETGTTLKLDAGEEQAVVDAVVSYVDAFNRGDAGAVADHWAHDAQYQTRDGDILQGREAIRQSFAALLESDERPRITHVRPRVRIISPGVAVEEGTVDVVEAGQPPETTTYIAIHVKRDGAWLLNTVRETNVPSPPLAANHEMLKDLEWMVGEWIDQSEVSTIQTVCQWSKNQSFLTRTFMVSAPGSDDLEGTQVIGWDPVAGVIRSWVFDSDGAYSEGTWTRKDNTWTVNSHGFVAEGQTAASVQVYTRLDDGTFTWKSIGRKIGDQFLPNIDEVLVTRKTTTDQAKQIEGTRQTQ